jgi:hypothetical protein
MAEIKYSEILAADEVLSAGANDIIVLAIVDGAAPTGYTSKAIKGGNLLNLQTVCDFGSTAFDLSTQVTITTVGTKIEHQSYLNEATTATLILDAPSKAELSFVDYNSGSNLLRVDALGVLITDEINLKGAFYAADYSLNFVARSLIDRGYADTNLGGSSLNSIFINPGGFEEGHVPSWDDLAQEYTLSPNLNGIYSGSGNFTQDADAALNGFSFNINSTAGLTTEFDGAGNLKMHGNGTRLTVGISAIDLTLPNGGVFIENEADLGNGSRFGALTGKSGTAFDNDITTFKLYSDYLKATIFDLNYGGSLSGRFKSNANGISFDSGNLEILSALRIADGSEGLNKVLTSDANGVCSWQVGGGGANTIYSADDDLAGNRTVGLLANNLIFSTTSEPNLLYLKGSNSRIGVGTLNPQCAFNVVGQVRFEGTSRTLLSTNVSQDGVGLGNSTPTLNSVHSRDIDIRFEGTTDTNLFFVDEGLNQISVGSTTYPDTKVSITNAEAKTVSFVVLSQDTTKNFQVLETGVVSLNTQLSVSAGTAPTSTSKVIVGGDIEVDVNNYHYFGPPSNNGTYRMGNNGLGNLVIEERVAGVWTNLQTW